jgi:uncharacterized protein YbcC (UPF0753/DUF2309 family)
VDQMKAAPYSETERMQLRAVVRLSSEIIADYWPMRTFVHHNPLHGLEDRHFHDAAGHAQQILGAAGYLPNEIFRNYFRAGRILPRHLDAALKLLAQEHVVQLGSRAVSQFEVLRARMLRGLDAPPEEVLATLVRRRSDRSFVEQLAERGAAAAKAAAKKISENESALEPRELLATWCDRNIGTQILEQINRELIKWCEAFLDEGHATWPMPGREKGFFGAWKYLATREWSPCGIKDHRRKLARLPAEADGALLDSLTALGIPCEFWQDYLSLHLTGLPGWAGFIKWRADQSEYEWQQSYPVDLVQYLAVRLWYERELVQKACRETLGIDGAFGALSAYAQPLGSSSTMHSAGEPGRQAALTDGWRLVELGKALNVDPAVLLDTPAENLRVLLDWIEGFPEAQHGPLWLKAFETGYEEALLAKLQPNLGILNQVSYEDEPKAVTATVRPQAQTVFCIDVRSEPLRRHLEAIGDYETYGFAGFFNVPIRYQALGTHHETDQLPVIVKPKNLVREISRTYHGQVLFKHQSRAKFIEAGHALLHDLKENVATPYVMVESLGWFFSLPMIGKTIFTAWYNNAVARLKRTFLPPVATTLTVDKLSRAEVEEMLAAEQRAAARRVLKEKFGDRHLNLSLERLEFLRRRALDETSTAEPSPQARSYALSAEEENAFVEELRHSHGINRRAAFARAERITRTGFTSTEQAAAVETALRIIGLTRNFARLVLFCGHRSTSENNPFEAALDCGACGGNPSGPNARVLALIANKPLVREQLAKNGIVIPQDTYFVAGQHDTTTDHIDLFDLEDLPPTHRKDLLQLVRDLEEGGNRNSRERCARFPGVDGSPSAAKAARHVRRRSGDWSQVRPEWGLSRNAAFIIGRRELTHAADLDGRVFLHSYDYREDPGGRLLEIVMTGPQTVAQWINMEHYFSTVDPEHYGSGSKIYHNIVGRLGVMSGPQSDLRTGLAWQTVMAEALPYHEPMRLLTLIEAPRERIDQVVRGHGLLQRLYDNEWVRLIAIEPEKGTSYRYAPKRGWMEIPQEKGASL